MMMLMYHFYWVLFTKRNCLSDLLLALLKHFYSSTFADINKKLSSYCSTQHISLIIENLCFTVLYAALLAEGVYGISTARARRSFWADQLMSLTRYVVAVFEVAFVVVMLAQAFRFEKLTAETKSGTGYTLVVYVLCVTLGELVLWGGYICVLNQYLMYSRRNPLLT
eukprot:TRINITY_DN3528_c0_g1_i7.p1 TRINITY_DN3528_c0_g1~~TRINITY_DN3528_c0_g1_i7.p1  ORF type:complete len:167 (-),score=17.30 TRINITY_DN3528_c0_g1_i7:359-859(-)